jgi:hypothetical protein
VTLFPSWLRSSFTQFFTLTKELLSVMSYTSSAPGPRHATIEEGKSWLVEG